MLKEKEHTEKTTNVRKDLTVFAKFCRERKQTTVMMISIILGGLLLIIGMVLADVPFRSQQEVSFKPLQEKVIQKMHIFDVQIPLNSIDRATTQGLISTKLNHQSTEPAIVPSRSFSAANLSFIEQCKSLINSNDLKGKYLSKKPTPQEVERYSRAVLSYSYGYLFHKSSTSRELSVSSDYTSSHSKSNSMQVVSKIEKSLCLACDIVDGKQGEAEASVLCEGRIDTIEGDCNTGLYCELTLNQDLEIEWILIEVD